MVHKYLLVVVEGAASMEKSTNQETEETNADQSQAGVNILLISVGVTGK